MRTMNLNEIAKRIDDHLRRMEADPSINKPRTSVSSPSFYKPVAVRCGPKLGISYVCYQHMDKISKADAERYLAALDRGDTRRHYSVLRDEVKPCADS